MKPRGYPFVKGNLYLIETNKGTAIGAFHSHGEPADARMFWVDKWFFYNAKKWWDGQHAGTIVWDGVLTVKSITPEERSRLEMMIKGLRGKAHI